MNINEAKRMVNFIADYMKNKDENPLNVKDFENLLSIIEKSYVLEIKYDFLLNTLKAIRGKNPITEEEIIADDAIKTVEKIK